jgi:hypothetical protein
LIAIGSADRLFAALLVAGLVEAFLALLAFTFLALVALTATPAAINLSAGLIEARQEIDRNECADRGRDHDWRA